MLRDWLDRIQDVLNGADTNDWIAAVVIGAAVQVLVLLIFRMLGCFFRMAIWLVASAIGVAVALYVLDRGGAPGLIDGVQIERLVDEVRGLIGR